MRSRTTAFCGRHPLFLAALVTVCCVLAASLGWAFGLIAGIGLAFVANYLKGWRLGAAWLLCGWLATAIFAWRVNDLKDAERGLMASPGVSMRGRILKDAKSGGTNWRAPAVLLEGPHVGTKVWWEGRGELPVAGSIVNARGNFGPLPTARNPGEFDQAAWLRSQGLAVTFRAGRVEGTVATGYWPTLGYNLRQGFRNAVTDGLDEASQEAAVIRAVVIGESPTDAEELVEAFRNSGTLHAFSVSGLHVAMVGTIGWFVLMLTGVSRRWAVLALLPLIFGYSWITGNSPPAVRSAWMAVVFLGAFVARRRPDLLNSLGAVLLAAMLWDGRLLFLPGVQLSYGVVAVIAIGSGWMSAWFSWIAKPELYLPMGMMNRWQMASLWLRRKIAQSLGVSLAAGVGSTPLTAFHFGLFTPVSVLAGVVFVPAVFVLLGISLFAAVVHPVVPPVARFANQANAYMAKFCVFTAESFSSIPGGHFQLKQENEPFLLVYDLDYGAGAGCFSGNGDDAVLMDCGDAYGFIRRVAPSLKRLGVTPDAVVLSHPDGGHLGGGSQVWETFPIRQVLLPVERSRSPAFRIWVNEAPSHGVKTLQAAAVRELPMPDGARLEIIRAADPKASNIPADDRVAIFRLHWRGWKLLFVSDAGMNTELELLETGKDVSADVIIAGHHGGDLNLGDRFLDAVNPQAIVASHSDFPSSEKLKPSAVSYWRARGIKVMHQGETGGVTVRVDDQGKLRLEGFANDSLEVLKHR